VEPRLEGYVSGNLLGGLPLPLTDWLRSRRMIPVGDEALSGTKPGVMAHGFVKQNSYEY